ncbi:MAG TPA: penicillin-binding protein 2 [Allosphingosinicella sp.]|jgi:penicillin-binding protein 2|nr:penicillin-binding protein 2 [Allosphingosinicella sp.]
MKRRLFGGGPPVTETGQAQSFSRRAFVLGTLQSGVALLLAGRMGYIAIAQNERYRGLAESNRVQTRLIPPRRGWIVDRHGRPMAINRADIRVDLIPDFIEDKEKLIAELTRLLALPPEEVQRIRADLEHGEGFQPVPVAEHLTEQQYYSVKVHEPDLPGVSVLEGYSRSYPAGAAVGHLLGYVGTPNQRDYEAENRNALLITPGFKVGKEGLEKVMEQRLRGRPGAARVEVTARGRLVRQLTTLPDVSGGSLRTTIDAGLQEFAARRLGEESGSCVILDCNNGDILALASMPAYDPNSFSDGISHSEWSMMREDERHPLINKTLNALYPPGSTFKPAVAMALLEAGVDPEETVTCTGGYTLGSRRFGCLGVHGSMNLHRAIAKSCNTYFYTMGRRIGIERFSAMAKRLGLGQRFDQLPVVSQSYGTIPDPAWKQRRYRQDWTQADTLNTAIGQGYVILNPLQLAVMAARVASGRDVQPRLVLDRYPPAQPLPFAATSFEAVRSGMAEVVNGNGTAGASRLPLDGIQMAGKTGTAQVRNIVDANRGRAGTTWRYRDHGLFIFFAPVVQPRYAGAVVIEHGLGGARAAAPVACDVMTYLFDKAKAEERLAPLEAQWGGTLAERMARRTSLWVNRPAGAPAPANPA